MKQYIKMKRLQLLIIFLFIFIGCGQDKNEQITSNEVEEIQTAEDKKLILFFGNSLSAGYGIEQEDSFPGLVAQRVDSLGLEYRVINGGLSGETTASGLSRLEWFLEEEPEVFILELGGNDGLRGIEISETKRNLKSMIQLVESKYPDTEILLAGMQIPPNMGQEYAANFRNMYRDVAEEENVTLIPFLLEGVAGDPKLNLPDGIHPTEEGHKIVFETVWEYLEPKL
jgi:acyl-CoA thioesterase-1